MKSGSPTPSEMAPSTPAMRSKNRRMPLAGMAETRLFVSGRIVFIALLRSSRCLWPCLVELRRALERGGDAEHRRLLERVRHDLKAYRQSVVREPAGN